MSSAGPRQVLAEFGPLLLWVKPWSPTHWWGAEVEHLLGRDTGMRGVSLQEKGILGEVAASRGLWPPHAF